ncbi:hypothetical protein GCK72_004773 [Caenorhabditis remanei]|uniref:Aquaporin n=1 Tax=Caenorhabditis remanei TaxID=31234 RepID=A0A6A5HEL3_CAERE|nr:hypothetical protein GCK72_004773 [Caenorhabditis remanei]KAF1764823.1 hypothetical protein GCK72_004773 [Caenorhabditis remanei]
MIDDDDKVDIYGLLPEESWMAIVFLLFGTFFLAVFTGFCRKLFSYCTPKLRDFLYEVIAAFSYCACQYSQGLFIAILIQTFIFQHLNKRHCENWLILMGEGHKNEFPISLIFSHAVGMLSFSYLLMLYKSLLPCQLEHLFFKNDTLQPIMIIVVLCEFLSGAAFHILLRQFNGNDGATALVYAIVFTITRRAAGVPAAHPLFFFFRFFSCVLKMPVNEGVIALVVHVFLPYIGWIFVPWVSRSPSTLKSTWLLKYERKQEQAMRAQRALEEEQRNKHYNLRQRNNRGGGRNRGR